MTCTLLISSLSDLWKRFAIHLTQQTPQNRADQEAQIFVFPLRTLVKWPRPLRVCISENQPSIWRVSVTLQKQWVPFQHSKSMLVVVPRPNSGSVTRKSAKFLLHRIKNGKNAEFQGLDVDYLVLEHIQVNKAPKMQHRTYRAHAWVNPYTRWSLLRKSRWFLNQKRKLHRRKGYPRRNKNLWPENKFNIKKNVNKKKNHPQSHHLQMSRASFDLSKPKQCDSMVQPNISPTVTQTQSDFWSRKCCTWQMRWWQQRDIWGFDNNHALS